ncbi:hypothetical protein J2046_001302 [Rhizobium petrolearium]|nr:hypothetical protein [Neorhizobium petrolearium]
MMYNQIVDGRTPPPKRPRWDQQHLLLPVVGQFQKPGAPPPAPGFLLLPTLTALLFQVICKCQPALTHAVAGTKSSTIDICLIASTWLICLACDDLSFKYETFNVPMRLGAE